MKKKNVRIAWWASTVGGYFFRLNTICSFGSCQPILLQCWVVPARPGLLACQAKGQNGRPDPMDTSNNDMTKCTSAIYTENDNELS